MKPLLAVLVLVLLGACSFGSGSPSAGGPSTPTSSASPRGGAGGQTCAEVRAGIDAFNQGDFQATVDHFRTAVPLAEALASADDSQLSRDLLEAVRYYADLAPDAYLRASLSSPDFARYKAITLGQCEAGVGPRQTPSPSDSGGVKT